MASIFPAIFADRPRQWSVMVAPMALFPAGKVARGGEAGQGLTVAKQSWSW